ncbi:putative serine/threonine-protein kinase WNK11 [Acorus calamus]|uniref:non-specific serine/threonine protein kinase n=1 Tax=Acorus calamus TaxID=4465 RepID=A0AAV9F0Y4_ACOCL|nr:putative serine/threonine-protein kinase WNK11 [Acorus calamus]
MPSMVGPSDKETEEQFVEVDPSGRYGRYKDLLGSGATKKVYRAFDQEDGIEVAWNQVNYWTFDNEPAVVDRLFAEVRLLGSLRHENIISFYHSWTNSEKGTLNFITEVKIGDLGLAAAVGKSRVAHSIMGTPEYMAPELYEEEYTEMVDIWSFGLCVLEMVTNDIPYSECNSIPMIYKKVSSGARPDSMKKVGDPNVRAFIERCLGTPRNRPSATELPPGPLLLWPR